VAVTAVVCGGHRLWRSNLSRLHRGSANGGIACGGTNPQTLPKK